MGLWKGQILRLVMVFTAGAILGFLLYAVSKDVVSNVDTFAPRAVEKFVKPVHLYNRFQHKNVINEEEHRSNSSANEAQEFDGASFVCFEVANLDSEKQSGNFTLEIRPDFAKHGAERFLELTVADFWSGCRFHHVVNGTVAEFGINEDPKVQENWDARPIPEDTVGVSNTRRTVSFSQTFSRTTHMLINTGDNPVIDQVGYVVVGEVSHGMDVVGRFYETKRTRRGRYSAGAPRAKFSYISKAFFVDHHGC